MAGWQIISIAVLTVGFLVVVSAQKSCPPHWPLCWVSCNYTEVQGPTCLDCNTKLICTKAGGLVRPCVWPGKRHCVDGQCVSQPSNECAATTEAVTQAAEAETQAAQAETSASAAAN